MVPRPAELTVEEFEVYTTNYNQLLDTIEASYQAWLEFTHDPFDEELTEAYLSYYIEPMLTAGNSIRDKHRSKNTFTELSGKETLEIDSLSVEFNDDYTQASATACQVDALLLFQKQPDGTAVLIDDETYVYDLYYELTNTTNGWKIRLIAPRKDENASTCS